MADLTPSASEVELIQASLESFVAAAASGRRDDVALRLLAKAIARGIRAGSTAVALDVAEAVVRIAPAPAPAPAPAKVAVVVEQARITEAWLRQRIATSAQLSATPSLRGEILHWADNIARALDALDGEANRGT